VKNLVITTVLTLVASGPSHAYETGSLTCQKTAHSQAQRTSHDPSLDGKTIK
jgi:hypothetical protein